MSFEYLQVDRLFGPSQNVEGRWGRRFEEGHGAVLYLCYMKSFRALGQDGVREFIIECKYHESSALEQEISLPDTSVKMSLR